MFTSYYFPLKLFRFGTTENVKFESKDNKKLEHKVDIDTENNLIEDITKYEITKGGDYLQKRITEITKECENIMILSSKKATYYKAASIVNNITLIIFAAIITFLSALLYLNSCDIHYSIAIMLLSALMTLQKSFNMVFSFDKKCVENRKIFVKTRKIIRELNELDINVDKKILKEKIRTINNQLDELELNIFLDGVSES